MASTSSPRYVWFFLLLACLGITARVAIVLLAGNQLTDSLSGGGDAPAYIRLSDSLYWGKGFSYVGQPSAFRPPLYPLLLVGVRFFVGKNYLFAVRVIQLLAGMATAWICALTAGEIWGVQARKACFALVLIFPTLLYFTGEILTETLASLMAALFLYLLARAKTDSFSECVLLGVTAGVASLLRFNMIFLPLVGGWRVFSNGKEWSNRWMRLLTVAALSSAFVLPWVIRNLIVFHGEVIYSTHTGMDLVEGIIEPEGRADSGEQQLIIREAGWVMQGLERDDDRRLLYPSEPILNQRAMRAGVRLWTHSGCRGVVVIAEKVADFWFSIDQLIGISNFSRRVQLLRVGGVVFYWCCLVAAVLGMQRLFRINAPLARTFLLYVVTGTALHLLFAMNTRLRAPLIDPLICVLASSLFSGLFLQQPIRRTSGATAARCAS